MEPLNAARTALLVVHLQHDIADEAGAFGPIFIEESRRNDTLGKSAALIDTVRSAGGRVSYAVIGFEPGYPDLVPNIPLLRMAKDAGAAVRGTWGTELVAEVAPADGDHVQIHTRPNPFEMTPLDLVYRAAGIDTVIVCGIATNASVQSAAQAAAGLGYRAILAADASSAATAAAHDAVLETFGLFGEVAANDEIAAALRG